MSYPSNNGYEPSVGFDYAALDDMTVDIDAQWWNAQGQLLNDILCWMTSPHSLARIGARCCLLAFYLNPEIINKSRLQDIASMPGSPSKAALSKAMIEFQKRYNLNPAVYQRPLWMRERYRRSAIVAHQTRAKSNENKTSTQVANQESNK